jgi:O-antigen/teichoic acid export membrane protein
MSSANALFRRARVLTGQRSLTTGTIGTIGLNTTSFALTFVGTVLVSRELGATGYGTFAFALACARVLGSISNLGLSALTVRYVADYAEHERWSRLRGLVTRLNQVVGLVSLGAIVVAAVVGTLVLDRDSDVYVPFLIGLLTVPLVVLTTQRQNVLQGLHRVILARIPETLVAPAIVIGLVLLALAAGVGLTAENVLWITVASQALAFALGVWFLFRALPPAVRAANPEYEHRVWLRVGIPLFVMGIVSAANAQVGVIVLGAIGESADAGVYAVAVRASAFVSFVMLAATYPLMPALARLRSVGDETAYRDTVMSATRSVVLVSAPIVVGLLVFAGPILDIFGSGFSEGAAAVRILVVGEVVRLLVAVIAIGMLMSGEERLATKILALGAVLNIGLALALAPGLGETGAAIAQTASAVVSSVLVAIFAHRRQGFHLRSFVWPAARRDCD